MFSDSDTDPSRSSASSSTVAIVSVAVPPVPTLTVRDPVLTPKSPSAVTVTLTVSGADGAGDANSVKVASWPSSPLVAPLMFTSGRTASVTVKRIGIVVEPAPLSVAVNSNS